MRLNVREYSIKTGISVQAVYKQIKSGKLKTEETKEGLFILFEEENLEATDNKQEQTAVLIERVKHLEEALRRAEADKEQLYKQLEQSNILQLKSLETLKQLEHKTDEMQEELKQEKQKTWIDKLFRK